MAQGNRSGNSDSLVSVTDHLGHVTRLEVNADGKLTRRIDPEGKAVTYDYDLDGRPILTVDGNGNEIAMEYEALAGGGCASCSGGGNAKPSRVYYPTFIRELKYDLRGRKTVETDLTQETSVSTQLAYDAAGNLVQKTDRAGRVSLYSYDALNRLSQVTDPAGGATRYAFDGRDNLLALTDAKNQETRFAYDRANRLVKETRPLGQETVYTYDAAGNLTEKRDAKNQKTVYTYDDAGRLITIRFYGASDHATPVKTVDFTYDAAGNLTGYSDGSTSAAYTYDDLHRKVAESVNYGAFTLSTGYSYLANGLKQSFTGPEGAVYAYTYDANNQLASVQIPGVGAMTVNEYAWTRPKSMTLPGGTTRSFAYDPLMRVKEIAARDPAANPLMTYGYAYDNVDNITAKATEHGSYAYTYDALDRLTGTDNPSQTDEAYTYDAVGNRLTSAEHAGWAYNANNELSGYDGVTFAYDANGNTIEKTGPTGTTRYFYNVEDRLSRVEDGAGSVIASYGYDPFGRRLWKEVSGIRTYFVYADEGLVAEADATGAITKTYGWKPGGTWGTDPLFMRTGGQTYFYHNDHLGTPQKLTSVSGAVVWAALYTAFGEAQVLPLSTVESNLRFAGQYFDAESGELDSALTHALRVERAGDEGREHRERLASLGAPGSRTGEK